MEELDGEIVTSGEEKVIKKVEGIRFEPPAMNEETFGMTSKSKLQRFVCLFLFLIWGRFGVETSEGGCS